mgnify:CR=1 FL=1
MTTVTSYPGIYIEEDNLPTFSVNSSPTAVPAFVMERASGPVQTKFTRVNSWADFKAAVPDDYTGKYTYYDALRYWFSQGGGYCYLVDYPQLDQLDKYDDITLVVASNHNTHIFSKLDAVVGSGKKRFVLLDGPQEQITGSSTPATLMADYPASPCAAAWYPWLKAEWSKKLIPPSVAAAVAIAQTDRNRGVWKAPANVVLNGLTPQFNVSDDLQGQYNSGKALNMFRNFPGSGTVAWGARTLEDSDNWRYIPVRRLFSSVEKDISRALNNLVFEPNSQPTWQRVRVVIDNYLHKLWQQGALAGSTPAEAWFVQTGKDITMTDDDINQGVMKINVGLAASRPAEFIVLQFTQSLNQP